MTGLPASLIRTCVSRDRTGCVRRARRRAFAVRIAPSGAPSRAAQPGGAVPSSAFSASAPARWQTGRRARGRPHPHALAGSRVSCRFRCFGHLPLSAHRESADDLAAEGERVKLTGLAEKVETIATEELSDRPCTTTTVACVLPAYGFARRWRRVLAAASRRESSP